MGFLDELKKLTRPYEEDEEDFEEDYEQPAPEEEPAEPPRAERRSFAPQRVAEPERSAPQLAKTYAAPAPKRDANVVNLRAAGASQVVLIKPERFETAAEIADHLRDRRTIIMNLESTSKDVARRLIDFLSGAAYAHDGKIRKAAANTYIITPFSVELMGDNALDEPESGGLYF